MVKYFFKNKNLEILPVENSFYKTFELKEKFKFSDEILSLNYSKYSPFKNTKMLHLYENQKLMLWFYEKEINSKVIIPEGYLLYKELKKQSLNSIFIMEKKDFFIVIVIKNGSLLSLYTQKSYDEFFINVTMEKFQIKNKIFINNNSFLELSSNIINNVTIKDIYQWARFESDYKEYSKKLLNTLSLPLSSLLFIYIFTNYFHTSYLNKELKTLEKNYLSEKNKNENKKDGLRSYNTKVKQWDEFFQNEIIYPDMNLVISKVSQIVSKEEETKFLNIGISNGIFKLQLRTKNDPIIYLNKLNAINLFSRVIIDKSSSVDKDGFKRVIYEIDLKKVKEL